MRKIIFITIVLVLVSGSAMADLFSDDFNSENGGVGKLNYGTVDSTFFSNWTVSDGTVDLIGSPGFYDWFGSTNGLYVDMDGSTSNAGKIATCLSLDPDTYILSFDLAGNQRNTAEERVDVLVGSLFSNSYSLDMTDPFTTYTETFTVLTAGIYDLSFEGLGFGNPGDNVGMLLDNVSVNVVPVPGAVLLGLIGLSAAGIKLRKDA